MLQLMIYVIFVRGYLIMNNKNVIEKLKEEEEIIYLDAFFKGFTITINDNGNNKGMITLFKKYDNVTYVEKFDIEGVGEYQISIKKNNKIYEDSIYYKDIIKWYYNYLYYDKVTFIYMFRGGKYNNMTMTKSELEEITNTKILKVGKKDNFNFRNELSNQPKLNEYLSCMYSHMDYGILFFRYETQQYYNDMSQ